MPALQRFLAILIADLRERTRTPRFWVVLAGMVLASWYCFPGPEAGYAILSLGHGERGVYSSAWIGMVLAVAYSLMLGLAGFYVVRGTLVRDIDTRVWQLLVATPMTRGAFLLAKWASHMLVLGLMVASGLVVGVFVQWLRAEDRHIDLIELVKPALLFSLPALAMTSMFAIWFDLLPWLRRTAGNIVFFFLWVTLLGVAGSQLENSNNRFVREGWISDPDGMVLAGREFHRVRVQQTGKPQDFGFSFGSPARKGGPLLIEWKSWTPRGPDMAGRGLWVLLSMLGVLASARLLDWSAARSSAAARLRSQTGRRLRWLDRLLDPLVRGAFGRLAVAELKLSLRQRRLWWWLLALVALGLQVLAGPEGFRMGMVLAWLLPLDLLARGVLREHEHGTGGLVFTSPNIVGRLLATRFVASFGLLLVLTAPGTVRLFAQHPIAGIAALVIAASIAGWGLCLGALFRNARPFELVLVATTYIYLQGAPIFDLQIHPSSTTTWHALALLPASLGLAWAWPRLARR